MIEYTVQPGLNIVKSRQEYNVQVTYTVGGSISFGDTIKASGSLVYSAQKNYSAQKKKARKTDGTGKGGHTERPF